MLHALILAAALTPVQVDTVITGAESAFSTYIFPDVAAKAVAILKEKEPSYRSMSDPDALIKAVNADLFAVTQDKHVRLLSFEGHLAGNGPSGVAEVHQVDEILNNGFDQVRRLPGNVGYIDVREFSNDADAGRTIGAAMNFVANTSALIIDLRKNGGGSPASVETLEAYFFARREQSTSLMMRDPQTGVVSEIKQYTDATVPGPRFLNKPVYLLTSNRTFSAAEQFTYDLHNLKRVTLVGETTRGGANPGDMKALGSGFAIFMPSGRAYSPITKTNWEGTGIAPDVATSADDALVTAYTLALKEAKSTAQLPPYVDEITRALADPAKALQL